MISISSVYGSSKQIWFSQYLLLGVSKNKLNCTSVLVCTLCIGIMLDTWFASLYSFSFQQSRWVVVVVLVVVKVNWVTSLEAVRPQSQQWHQLHQPQVLLLQRNQLLQSLMWLSRSLQGSPAKPTTITGLMGRTLATSLRYAGFLLFHMKTFLVYAFTIAPHPFIFLALLSYLRSVELGSIMLQTLWKPM